MWIDGTRHEWIDPSRKVLHQCGYELQKRLGVNIIPIIDELLQEGIHSRDLGWAIIETQFSLKVGTDASVVSARFKREALKLARERSKAG
jgi:hypothetical protein